MGWPDVTIARGWADRGLKKCRLRAPKALLAFFTGIISAYSSTSSVVLPAFLPMVPGIAARLPGTDAIALAISINIGSAMVDVSPLSTIGALCVAAAPEGSNKPQLFASLMIWGFAMAFVAAGICYFASPWFPPTAGFQ